MPKVLRIINRFNLGGPTHNVAYLTKYLSPEFETCLAGGMKEEAEADSEYIVKRLGIHPVYIPSMKRSINPLNDFESFRQLKKIIKEFKPDIVHTHAAKAGTIGRLAALACSVPVIVHTFHGHVFHSYFGPVKTYFYKTIERELAKRSSAIVAISEKQKYELSSLHKIAPVDKIRVIPLGLDLNCFQENMEAKRKLFRDEYQLDPNEIAIGIIGRLVPIKNHELFIRAIGFVAKNSSTRIKAFIIGDGEERNALLQSIKDAGLDSKIVFTSWIKEVDKALAGLDILCLTSLNEGTPVSLIEAQAANKPIVATKVGGVENTVWENKTALLSDIHDPALFFSNLFRLVENKNSREELSSKGWEFVKNKFHFSRLVEDMAKLYYELLK